MINKYVDNLKIKGDSIQTKYGIMRPILVEEYEEFIPYISLLKKIPATLKSILFKMVVDSTDDYDKRAIYKDQIDNNDIVYFMKRNDFGLRDSVDELLDFIMESYDEEVYTIIFNSDEDWDEFRRFILDFNGITVQEESDDAEIQKFDAYSQALKEAKGEAINFESIYTSIIVKTGMIPEQINKLTIYQFYSIFRRIGAFFNYETTTLYKTIDTSGKIKVVPWSKIINKPKKKEIKFSDFASKFGEDFN